MTDDAEQSPSEIVREISSTNGWKDPDRQCRLMIALHSMAGRAAEALMLAWIRQRSSGWKDVLSALCHLGTMQGGFAPATVKYLIEVASARQLELRVREQEGGTSHIQHDVRLTSGWRGA